MNQLGELTVPYMTTSTPLGDSTRPDIPDGATYSTLSSDGSNATLLVLADVTWWQANYPSATVSAVWHGAILFSQPTDIPASLFERLVRFGARELLATPWTNGVYAYNVRYASTANQPWRFVVSALWNLSRFQSDEFSETIQNWIDSQFAQSAWDATAYPLAEVASAFTNVAAVLDTTYPTVSIGVFGNPLAWDTSYADSVALCEQFAAAHEELQPPG